MSASIAQNPMLEGYVGVETAVAALKKQPVTKRYDTGVQVVTADNAKAFLANTQAGLTVGIDRAKYPDIR